MPLGLQMYMSFLHSRGYVYLGVVGTVEGNLGWETLRHAK